MSRLDLGVNIDHIATLRQARGTRYPSPIEAALLAETAGADSITLHLREDRRHIQDQDVFLLREALKTRMNLEMALTDEMLEIALKVKPHDVCLVPEKREELTTEGGLNIIQEQSRVQRFTQTLQAAGIRVSLFIDANPAQIEAAVQAGAQAIELHTGRFAEATTEIMQQNERKLIKKMAQLGVQSGLKVNAGHGLHYHNVQAIAKIEQISELNIGHAIVAQALFVGWENAVREMKHLMSLVRV